MECSRNVTAHMIYEREQLNSKEYILSYQMPNYEFTFENKFGKKHTKSLIFCSRRGYQTLTTSAQLKLFYPEIH